MKPASPVVDTIHIDAVVSIGTIANLKTALCRQLSEGRALYLDASFLRQVDLTFVQLTISALKDFETKDLSFQIGGATEILRQAFERSGVRGRVVDQLLVS